MKVMSKFYNKISKRSVDQLNKHAEQQFFLDEPEKFSKIPREIVHHVQTVNSVSSVKLIKDNNIDVIIFLGGDIAKNDFIRSSNLICLNIHTGLSPFYNGAASSFWTISEFRPNFSGVTLMIMNEIIDGGDILGHYLPEIEENDSVSTLFLKGIKGAVRLVSDAVNHINNNGIEGFEGIPQVRSFKYTRGMDWTIYNDLRVNKFHASGKMKAYVRPEMFFTYYDKNILEYAFAPLLEFILNNRSNK